ncbi:hypothetical protein ACK30V_11695, partial [Aeromonas caviae]
FDTLYPPPVFTFRLFRLGDNYSDTGGLEEAYLRGLTRLSLETGSQPFFAPAHHLYHAFGFEECGPFGHYREDPYSRFMTKAL